MPTYNSRLTIRTEKRLLNEILKKHLVSEKTYKKKFSRLSFDQLITWCYLAGLINEEIREDLDKIRDIRNKFAHKIDITSFNHQWVASRCNNFHALKVLNKVLPNVELRTAKEKYLSVATLYLGLLLEKTKSIKRIK